LNDTTVSEVRQVLQQARLGAGGGGQMKSLMIPPLRRPIMSLIIPPLGREATVAAMTSLLQALANQEPSLSTPEPKQAPAPGGWEVVVCVCDMAETQSFMSASELGVAGQLADYHAQLVDCSNVGGALNQALGRAAGTLVSIVSGCLRCLSLPLVPCYTHTRSLPLVATHVLCLW
jgi:hypothetical protein